MISLLKLKPHALVLTGLLFSATALAIEHKAYEQFNAGAAFAPSFSFGERNCFGNYDCDTFSYKENYDAGYVAVWH